MTSPRLIAHTPDVEHHLLPQMTRHQIINQIVRGLPGSLPGGRHR